MVIVGPEAPLVSGIVDACRDAGIKAWGPTAYCAQLEGSKTFAKEFMAKNNIPTAAYQGFTDADAAKAYIDEQGAPIVIKADGLAAGKGVIVAETIEQAYEAIDDMLAGNKFGDAGSRVVIEQFLQGEEASFICMIDGDNILPMATSQDHKRAYEGDTGPNTGGMGAYSPAPVVTQAVHDKVMAKVIQPVVDAMKAAGHPYTGFLYAGLMIDKSGDPYVIEFNCRFGDPNSANLDSPAVINGRLGRARAGGSAAECCQMGRASLPLVSSLPLKAILKAHRKAMSLQACQSLIPTMPTQSKSSMLAPRFLTQRRKIKTPIIKKKS